MCDREVELSELSECFAQERNVVLYAWRRLGKTALIRHFCQQLENSHEVETLYVDLMATRSVEEAISAIAEAVVRRYAWRRQGLSGALRQMVGALGLELSFDPVSGMPSVSLGLRQHASAPQSLESIGTFLAKRSARVLIAFIG